MANPHAHDVARLDKVSEGRRPDHFFNNAGTVLNLQLRPSVYMGLFRRNVEQISLNPSKNLSIESL